MRTLHVYLGKELLKTFLMTAVALTLLVVLGGGVANIFRGEGLGADELLQVFGFLTPVAVTLILPVAALFSAAITYGRAAADNEIVACRAAGVNIHRLLLTPALMGLVVTLVTYWAWNFFIPQLLQSLEDVTRRDIPTIVMKQFERAKPLIFGRYRITADRCQELNPREAGLENPENHTLLVLTGVGFVELTDDEVMRYGTSDATLIDFDRGGANPKVTVDLQGVRTFDASRGQYYDLAHQILGPFEIPVPIRRKIKFEKLSTLLEFDENPTVAPEIEDRLHGIRRELMTFVMYQEVADQLRRDGAFSLSGEGTTYTISAEKGSQDPDDARPTLELVHVTETGPSGQTVYAADRATIELRSSMDRTRPIILVELLDNVEIRPKSSDGDVRVLRKQRETLKPMSFVDQPSMRSRYEAIDVMDLLHRRHVPALPKKQLRQCERLWERLAEFRSEVTGEVHFRASYSVSTVAVVVLGAVLGIIVRGGQVLTAFGISCVPTLIVVLSSIVGRNLAESPAHTSASVGIMWGATGFIFAATFFMMFKVLRR